MMEPPIAALLGTVVGGLAGLAGPLLGGSLQASRDKAKWRLDSQRDAYFSVLQHLSLALRIARPDDRWRSTQCRRDFQSVRSDRDLRPPRLPPRFTMKALQLCMVLFLAAAGFAQAAGGDGKIVGKWRCSSEDFPPVTFTFTAHNTWTDGQEKGTYVYDDRIGKLHLLPDGSTSFFGLDEPPLMWLSNSHFTWSPKPTYTEHFSFDCKKKS